MTCSLEGNPKGVSETNPKEQSTAWPWQRVPGPVPAPVNTVSCFGQWWLLPKTSRKMREPDDCKEEGECQEILYLIHLELYGKVSPFSSSHIRSQQTVISFDSQSLVSQPLCPLLPPSLDTGSASGSSAQRGSEVEAVMSGLPDSWHASSERRWALLCFPGITAQCFSIMKMVVLVKRLVLVMNWNPPDSTSAAHKENKVATTFPAI